jgi:hypothetical protein
MFIAFLLGGGKGFLRIREPRHGRRGRVDLHQALARLIQINGLTALRA